MNHAIVGRIFAIFAARVGLSEWPVQQPGGPR